jgi:hypothetical protein
VAGVGILLIVTGVVLLILSYRRPGKHRLA